MKVEDVRYPNCTKFNLLSEHKGKIRLNEAKWFGMLDYATFRNFEDMSSYSSRWAVPDEKKIEDVEKFLGNRGIYRGEDTP